MLVEAQKYFLPTGAGTLAMPLLYMKLPLKRNYAFLLTSNILILILIA